MRLYFFKLNLISYSKTVGTACYPIQQTQSSDLATAITVHVDWDKLKIKRAAPMIEKNPDNLVSKKKRKRKY